MEALLAAVGSAAAGLAAGYAGVHFALARMKKQRIAERRAEWYEGLVSLLFAQSQAIEARTAVEEAGYGLRLKDGAFLRRLFSDVVEMRGFLEKSYMFASPSTHQLLQDFDGALLQFERMSGTGPDGTVFMPPIEHGRLTSKLMRLLAIRLAVEYREHLGMEPLDVATDSMDSAVRQIVSAAPLELAVREHEERRGVDLTVQASDDGGDTWFEVHAGNPVGIRIRQAGDQEWRVVVQPGGFKSRSELGAEITSETSPETGG